MNSVIASPSTRALAGREGVDINELASELGRETIAKEDIIRKASGTPLPSSAPAGAEYWNVDHSAYGIITEEPISRIAQVAAANLAAAQTLIPAVTHHDRADMTMVERFRPSLKDEAAARGVKLTGLAFHVKALAKTLRAFPRFNASLSKDGETLLLKDYVHIGIAVDTPHGLLVPAIRDADKKGLWALASEIADIATRAKNRKIRPEEMGGASMSITNLGGIGGTAFTPIVNPPEVAILGISKTEMAPVWDGQAFVPTPLVPLDLSYDHRVINGAEAARFMVHFSNLLADPRRIII
ncbi:2-oxo acid dehydrogenase subunit E2 [Ruegeria sp. EL01]|jgi:pyruvate dehydrogenase E2 component (dihydrolipoamide acetyltransferase)|uniref:2-oxo acid dehydrogenase subunit E2 n=1 Tax=Ruegeria sp. EL01 TaxID=2107578 RepID=UPI000EA80149|nr:2-oxo acid dehydrogenase subunit E2 [Ruegeria sp. EL01]